MEASKIEHDIFDKLVANKLITSFILNPNDEQNFKTTQAEIPNIFSVWDECFSSARNYKKPYE